MLRDDHAIDNDVTDISIEALPSPMSSSRALYNFAVFKHVVLSGESPSHFQGNKPSLILKKNDFEMWISCLSCPSHKISVPKWCSDMVRMSEASLQYVFSFPEPFNFYRCPIYTKRVDNRTIGTNGGCQNEMLFTKGIPMNRAPFHLTQFVCIGQWLVFHWEMSFSFRFVKFTDT